MSQMPDKTNSESIVLGGGCFWCLDAAFRMVKGVTQVVSGYAGGAIENPTYEQVSYEETGHAEVVEVTFDPAVISLDTILIIFWSIHDPTTLNRQGNDVGSQYRSAIYFREDQSKTVQESLAEANKVWANAITTEIKPLTTFYPAEDYHQDYFAKNPEAGYCQIVINPKLVKFREKFSQYLLN